MTTRMTDEQVARLRDVLEFVTTSPERWDQCVWYVLPSDEVVEREPGVDWTCGTSACVAGWTALRAGYRPLPGFGRATVRDSSDRHRLVDEVARELLGLTVWQADQLFHSENNLRDLWELARVFTRGRLAVPPAVAGQEPDVFTLGQDYWYRDDDDDDTDDDD